MDHLRVPFSLGCGFISFEINHFLMETEMPFGVKGYHHILLTYVSGEKGGEEHIARLVFYTLDPSYKCDVIDDVTAETADWRSMDHSRDHCLGGKRVTRSFYLSCDKGNNCWRCEEREK